MRRRRSEQQQLLQEMEVKASSRALAFPMPLSMCLCPQVINLDEENRLLAEGLQSLQQEAVSLRQLLMQGNLPY
jgi:hypothetical protein